MVLATVSFQVLVRLRAEPHLKLSAVYDVVPCDVAYLQGLAVESQSLDINVLRAVVMGDDGERGSLG